MNMDCIRKYQEKKHCSGLIKFVQLKFASQLIEQKKKKKAEHM